MGESGGTGERIVTDMRAAMKSGDKLRVSTLRLLMAEMKNTEIASGEAPGDDVVVGLVGKEMRRRVEAIEQFEKGGRTDLVDKEKAEKEILAEYMPVQLSDDDLSAAVDQAIKELGSVGPKDKGKVMASVMPKVRGQAEGARVSAMVAAKLQS